jgi:tetratricopeptide (TPR) repeat protein
MRFLFPVLLFVVFFSGCSSAPKKPVEVFTDRTVAANQLNLANHTANRGRYEDALLILEDAWRLVLGTDDPPLRIKTTISRGSILFYLGRHDEAFSSWESAAREADSEGEPLLAAQARMAGIRATLLLLAAEHGESGQTADAAAEEFKAQLNREMAEVRSDPLSTAAGYVTLGLAEKQLRRWTEAENAIRQAFAIHERGLFLEDAAYDWFLIASVRSMAGNYNAALEALTTSISFDRRAENSFGIASSWQAMGDVYQKAGRSLESQAAYRRAADIYRAIGLNDRAEKLEGP